MSGPYFLVPAGAQPKPCGSCQRPIYWARTHKGNPMPVDVVADGVCEAPTATADGCGISHFATCPNANAHRKSRA